MISLFLDAGAFGGNLSLGVKVVLFVGTGCRISDEKLAFYSVPWTTGGRKSAGENLMMLPLRLRLI